MDNSKFSNSIINLDTEQRNPKTYCIDSMSTHDILKTMNEEDAIIPLSISKVLPKICEVVDSVVEAFKSNHRLIYMGAGTSGRLGVLDASECPPTFGVDKNMVVGLIAGGDYALRNAVEHTEDVESEGVADLKAINLSKGDVVVALAASGRTPYCIGGVKYARDLGCTTACIVCSKDSELAGCVDIEIAPNPGPEVVTGSTRLKSGTSQKMICNMITTTSMIKIGKVYQNLMVDVKPTNKKLEVRACNIVVQATGIDSDTAYNKLKECSFNPKVAIVSILLNCSADQAKMRIEEADGHVRAALK